MLTSSVVTIATSRGMALTLTSSAPWAELQHFIDRNFALILKGVFLVACRRENAAVCLDASTLDVCELFYIVHFHLNTWIHRLVHLVFMFEQVKIKASERLKGKVSLTSVTRSNQEQEHEGCSKTTCEAAGGSWRWGENKHQRSSWVCPAGGSRGQLSLYTGTNPEPEPPGRR